MYYSFEISVESVTSDFCKTHHELNVTRSRGFLVSDMTSEASTCDASSHPWVIKGRPGQRVRLTLYDFALGALQDAAYNTSSENRTGGDPEPTASVCKDHGIIYDNGRHRMTFLCGQNRRRVSNAFVSVGHLVKVWMTSSLNNDGVYLVQYEGTYSRFFTTICQETKAIAPCSLSHANTHISHFFIIYAMPHPALREFSALSQDINNQIRNIMYF